MSPRAFILGGAGQTGLAMARRLAQAGWRVTLGGRSAPPLPGPWEFARCDPRDLAPALPGPVDLLISCIAFDAADAAALLAQRSLAGRILALSSVSVYRDAAGRTLDEAPQTGFPQFPVPIPEDHPTVAPGPETYSTRKVAMEQHLLDQGAVPVTILRPAAIHGPHSKHAREWWFVKRLLDGRRAIPLAYRGDSRFQTTATAAIAEAVLAAAEGRLAPVAAVTDADCPSLAEIGRAIMAHLGITADLIGLPDAPFPPRFGSSPWSVAGPMICASSAPNAGSYAQTVGPALDWLMQALPGRDWTEVLPQLASYARDKFDYANDDAALDLPGAATLRP